MRKLLIVLVVCSSPLVAAQHTPGSQNPCEEHSISQSQMAECADFQFKQADARLNKIYGNALKYMSDDLARAERRSDKMQMRFEETAITSLKDAERTWLSYRDIQCKAAGQQYEGGSMAPMIYSQCLRIVTEHRIDDLKSIYEDGDHKLE